MMAQKNRLSYMNLTFKRVKWKKIHIMNLKFELFLNFVNFR